MLEPFSNTLEDHAKHKVRELGCVPLFPTLLRPLELCHQLINEHNALSFSPSLSLAPFQYVFSSFSVSFRAAAQKFESSGEAKCIMSGSFLLRGCMYAGSI